MKVNPYLETIRRELSGERTPDAVPAGWFTVDQLAEVLKCGASTVRRRIKARGWQPRVFRVLVGQRAFPVPHYQFSAK